jgi:tetratricopeptide (TPR) repeat protein
MEEAARCLRRTLQRARAERDTAGVAVYAQNLAAVERESGRYDEAERLIGEAVELCREMGSLSGLEGALNELAGLHIDRGRPAAVLPLAHEGLALCESTGFTRAVPYFHQRLAEAHYELGDDRAAAEHARLALDAIEASGDRGLEPGCRVRLGLVELRGGRLRSALLELQQAARVAIDARSPRVQLAVLLGYARYLVVQRRGDEARPLYAAVAGHGAAIRRQRETASAELAAWPSDAASVEPADLAQALDRLLGETALS